MKKYLLVGIMILAGGVAKAQYPAGIWFTEHSLNMLFSQDADNQGGVIGVEDSLKVGWDGSIWRVIISRNDTSLYLKDLPGSGGTLGVSSSGGVYEMSGGAAETDPYSLHLDQTSAQTVTGGKPNFSGGINVNNNFAINTLGKFSEYGNATPANGQILIGDGTDMELTFDPSLMSPQQGIFHFTEFDGNTSNTSIVATATMSGTVAVSYPSASSENSISGAVSGVWKLATGTTSTGYGALAQTGATISNMLNKGVAVFETSIAFLDSATAANDYFFRTGFGYTSFAALNPSNGVYFKYNRSASGHYWICSVANSGVISNNVTATAVVEDTYTVLRIEVDQANSAAKFYINGTLVYTYSGTINANLNNNMDTEMVKTNGTSTREVLLDYMWWWMRWYTPQTNRGTFSSVAGY